MKYTSFLYGYLGRKRRLDLIQMQCSSIATPRLQSTEELRLFGQHGIDLELRSVLWRIRPELLWHPTEIRVPSTGYQSYAETTRDQVHLYSLEIFFNEYRNDDTKRQLHGMCFYASGKDDSKRTCFRLRVNLVAVQDYHDLMANVKSSQSTSVIDNGSCDVYVNIKYKNRVMIIIVDDDGRYRSTCRKDVKNGQRRSLHTCWKRLWRNSRHPSDEFTIMKKNKLPQRQ